MDLCGNEVASGPDLLTTIAENGSGHSVFTRRCSHPLRKVHFPQTQCAFTNNETNPVGLLVPRHLPAATLAWTILGGRLARPLHGGRGLQVLALSLRRGS